MAVVKTLKGSTHDCKGDLPADLGESGMPSYLLVWSV